MLPIWEQVANEYPTWQIAGRYFGRGNRLKPNDSTNGVISPKRRFFEPKRTF